MRKARWLLDRDGKDATSKPAIFHCVSRVVDRRFVFAENPLFPALRSSPTAVSGASRQKQIPSSIAAAVLCDAVVRLLPGALGDSQSAIEESFSDPNLLEAPCYTRPVDFMGKEVPEVLLSGNHAKIAGWRHEKSVERTRWNRPDLNL